MEFNYRELTVEEISIAKDKFTMINPIYRGTCPLCGKAIVEDERYDGYYPEVVYCTNCCWHEDEFSPFEVISGTTEEEVKLINTVVSDGIINITDNKSICEFIKLSYISNYDELGDALLKYYSYKIRHEEYHSACKTVHWYYENIKKCV